MNLLTSSQETSIVSSTPGTTRDLVRSQIRLDGHTVQLTDTAGLRSAPQDEIERIGIQRARKEA